jgi:putative endonuclease
MGEHYVYIMASWSRRLYIGVTNDLRRRVNQHRRGSGSAFTRRYRFTNLVYFERVVDLSAAMARETQLKRWTRRRKERLIEAQNAGWLDLTSEVARRPRRKAL